MSKIGYIQRYLLLIRRVRNHPYITLEELRQGIEQELIARGEPICMLSQRTIERDIRDIRTALGVSIDYSRTERGYFIPHDEESNSDLERILESFEVLTAMRQDTGVMDFIFPEQRRATGTEHLYGLIQVIRDTHPVTFDYRKFWLPSASRRTMEPYALKESQGRWYVVGVDCSNRQLKTFGLDRIGHLEIGNTRFRKDPAIDIRERFRHSLTVDISEKVEHIVFSVGDADAAFLKTMPLHASQQIVCETSQRTTFSMDVYLTPDVVMSLLSRAGTLRIEEPEPLREEILEIYENGIRLNR